MTTWRKKIEKSLKFNNETWDDIVDIAIYGGLNNLDRDFDDGFGSAEGNPITI